MTISIERTMFFSSTGERVAATLYQPLGSLQEKCAACVLCQGLSGVQEFVLPEIATHLAKAGFLALTFDYRGFGKSEGKTGLIDLHARTQDALDACNFVRSLPQVDSRRIGIYGHSLGGGIAQKAALLDRTLSCLISTSGFSSGEKLLRSLRTNQEWLEFKEILEEDRIERVLSGKSRLVDIMEIFTFSSHFKEEYSALTSKKESSSIPENKANHSPLFQLYSADLIMQFETLSMLSELAPKPALFIHGALDDVIPIEDTLNAYAKLSEPKKIVIFDDYDHIGLDHGQGLQEVIRITLDWLTAHL
jgi:uncharacterized protein